MSDITTLMMGAAGQVGGDYTISKSLRFNSADSAYLSRTPASAGNRKTWTWSGWVKRGQLSNEDLLFSSYPTAGDANQFRFSNDNKIGFYTQDGVTSALVTTQVFRDVSAWYHIVLVVDTTQATSSNRIKLYVNGSQITAFDTATYPSQNYDTGYNDTILHTIGENARLSGKNYDGLMADIHFIDGQALTPSSFGEVDEVTGVWKPIRYAGSYGTNGFKLSFSDNSNTTATTLGKDDSGNGNNWTPNNFSVTAGAGNDSLVDSPTQYGTDTGAGGEVRGNYCTWNPLDSGTTEVITNGNLDVKTNVSGTYTSTRASFGISSGKWYWEVTCNAPSPTASDQIGIGTAAAPINSYFVSTSNGYGYQQSSGQKWTNDSGSAYGASYTTNDVIGVALDMDAGTLTFYKNGSSQGTAFSSLSGTFFPMIFIRDTTGSYSANFGQRPFAYTAPSGFKALCTTNLPDPTVVQGDQHFNTVLYSGAGTQAITGVGFQPDMVWLKSRSNADGWAQCDAVRGADKLLQSNNTNAESTTASVSAFSSDGFTVDNNWSTSGRTYVSYSWKANGAGSSNTDGTNITTTVSANTTAGISILTYTGDGNGSSSSIGHGLGVVPAMVIIKSRGARSWVVKHKSLSSGYNLYLESTAAQFTAASQNSGGIADLSSSTVVSFVNGAITTNNVNANAENYVAYCFAEVEGFSKFGSYTGNGSTDGPFVYTGFRPAWVMIKRISDTSHWNIVDVKRDPYNVMNKALLASSSSAEDTTYPLIDALSNGFKVRQSLDFINQNTGTFIYVAFASNPFKTSLAR